MKEIPFEKVANLVVRQNEHIALFNNDTPESLLGRIEEEVIELREAIKNEGSQLDVESELGDLLYLLIRLSQMTNIDLIEAVLAKYSRNWKKYYKQESREQAKANWGDKDHEYLDNWTKAFREKQAKKKALTTSNQ